MGQAFSDIINASLTQEDRIQAAQEAYIKDQIDDIELEARLTRILYPHGEPPRLTKTIQIVEYYKLPKICIRPVHELRRRGWIK